MDLESNKNWLVVKKVTEYVAKNRLKSIEDKVEKLNFVSDGLKIKWPQMVP